MKKLNRRDFLKMGALASATGVLASCAQRPEETEAPAVEPETEEMEPEPEVEEAPEICRGRSRPVLVCLGQPGSSHGSDPGNRRVQGSHEGQQPGI